MNQADDLPLQDRKVLVTRPEAQSQTLCDLIRSAGGEAILLPAIEIKPKPLSVKEIQLLDELGEGDTLIFTSRNAVRFFDHIAANPARRFGKLKILAVGTGTGKALKEKGIRNVVCPEEGAGSEALLELDVLQGKSVQGMNVVIMRGEGGRELLQDTLRARGAHVGVIELYRRIKPVIDTAVIKHIWEHTPPDVIVITSGEGLRNLIEITPIEERKYLFNTPVVVISDRIRDLAISSGFTHYPRVAGNPADEGLLMAMMEILEERQNER